MYTHTHAHTGRRLTWFTQQLYYVMQCTKVVHIKYWGYLLFTDIDK